MNGMHKTHGESEARIESAPLTTREELLEAVFGEPDTALGGTTPKAMEWVDLADAGPYVDELSVPVFTTDEGVEIWGDPIATAEWVSSQLSGLPRVGHIALSGQTSQPYLK